MTGGKVALPSYLQQAQQQAPPAKPAWMQKLASNKNLGPKKPERTTSFPLDSETTNNKNNESSSQADEKKPPPAAAPVDAESTTTTQTEDNTTTSGDDKEKPEPALGTPKEGEEQNSDGGSDAGSNDQDDDDGRQKYRLVALVSDVTGSREQQASQQRSLMLLQAIGIKPQKFYAGDPGQEERRDKLCAISGYKGVYPQFFLVPDDEGSKNGVFDFEKGVKFVGKYEDLQDLADDKALTRESLGLAPEVNVLTRDKSVRIIPMRKREEMHPEPLPADRYKKFHEYEAMENVPIDEAMEDVESDSEVVEEEVKEETSEAGDGEAQEEKEKEEEKEANETEPETKDEVEEPKEDKVEELGVEEKEPVPKVDEVEEQDKNDEDSGAKDENVESENAEEKVEEHSTEDVDPDEKSAVEENNKDQETPQIEEPEPPQIEEPESLQDGPEDEMANEKEESEEKEEEQKKSAPEKKLVSEESSLTLDHKMIMEQLGDEGGDIDDDKTPPRSNKLYDVETGQDPEGEKDEEVDPMTMSIDQGLIRQQVAESKNQGKRRSSPFRTNACGEIEQAQGDVESQDPPRLALPSQEPPPRTTLPSQEAPRSSQIQKREEILRRRREQAIQTRKSDRIFHTIVCCIILLIIGGGVAAVLIFVVDI